MSEDDKPPNKILVAILIILGLLLPLSTVAPEATKAVAFEQKVSEMSNEPTLSEDAFKVAFNRLEDEPRKIIKCESNDDPKICNLEFGCGSGMGLWGFIKSTWNETLDRMFEAEAELPERCWEKIVSPISENRTEMVFDAECNLLVGLWLYDMDGDIHWRPYSGKCYLNN